MDKSPDSGAADYPSGAYYNHSHEVNNADNEVGKIQLTQL